VAVVASLGKTTDRIIKGTVFQLKGPFVRSALLSMVARFGAVIGGYISLSIISRTLSFEQFGVFSFVLSVQTLLTTVVELGVTPTLIRFSSYHIGNGQEQEVYGVYKLALVIKLVVNAALLLIGLSLSQFVATELYKDAALALPIAAGIVLASFFSFQNYFIGVLRSNEKFDLVAVAFVVQYVAQVAALVVVRVMNYNSIILSIGSYLFGLLFFFGYSFIYYPWRKVAASPLFLGRERFSEYWRFLKWIALGYIASAFMLQVNVPILQYFWSAQEVARYFSAFKIVQLFWIMETVVGFVLLPRLSYLSGKQDWQAIKRLVKTLFVGVAALSAVLSLLMALFTPYLLSLVFGNAYVLASDVLYVLIPAGVCYFFFNTGGIVLLSLGRPHINAKLGLLGVAINLVSSIILIPLYGAIGSAMAAQATLLVPTILVWFIAWRHLRERPA
jgi:O-antigen/teichoic acid export membrane protein